MSAAPPSNGRLHELDALRGLAALGVVFWHYGAHFHAYPLRNVLFPFYNAGFLLVDFFFVLSGYVLARSYWRKTRQWHPYRNIWARVARLYPLHLLTLLATIALVITLPPGANDPNFNQPTNNLKHLALNLALLNQVGLQDGWSFNTPAWSISTEFIVNVVFLAFISLTAKARSAGLILLAAAGLLLVVASHRPYIVGDMAFGYLDVNLIRCFIGFSSGVMVYLLVSRFGGGGRLAAAPRSTTLLGICAMLAMGVLLAGSGRHPPMWHYLASIAVATWCVLLTPFSPVLRTLLCRKSLVFLGEVSYSIYLVHYPIQLALYSLSARGALHMDYASPATLAAYIAAVIGASVLTHRYIELPWQSRLLDFAARRAQSVQ